jgi:hypothetical protein
MVARKRRRSAESRLAACDSVDYLTGSTPRPRLRRISLRKEESQRKSLRERISIDPDLYRKEKRAKERAEETVYNEHIRDPKHLERTLEVLIDASKAEQDRETNLNARGAAVASVAALVVSLSSAVAKSVFQTKDWTDWSKVATGALFVAALFAVATAMVMAVMGVLRPKRGRGTKNFLGETLVNLWLGGHAVAVVDADKDRLNLLFLQCCLRTLPEWHMRNRRKARWLRRSWMFLAIGTAQIALAAVLVLARLTEIIKAEANGPANDLELWYIAALIAGLAIIAWIALRFDLVRAGRRRDPRRQGLSQVERAKNDEAAEIAEINEIADKLAESPCLAHEARRAQL